VSNTTATTADGPAENSTRPLGPAGARFLAERGLDLEIADRYGIYTARGFKNDQGEFEFVPDVNGTSVAYPFVHLGREVNTKYRAVKGKRFAQTRGGYRTFWNADVLEDPQVRKGHADVVIVEGENDALAAIQSGFPFTMSVPDGAPSLRDGDDPEELGEEPETESQQFLFVYNNRQRLKHVRRFILAVDSDRPGIRLAAELRRRFTAARCAFVEYPEGCKDLNDVLRAHGEDGVRRVIEGARPYPVDGIYRLSEYPEAPPIRPFSTGIKTLDGPPTMFKLFAGELCVITGRPGDGKSSFVMHMLRNMGRLHGWSFGIFSPEMPTVPFMRDKLRRIHLGKKTHDRQLDKHGNERTVQLVSDEELTEADAFIEQHFIFIDTDPNGEADADLTLEWLIDRAIDSVYRYGIRVLVIDPWNEVEHAKDPRELMTDYISRSLRKLKRFARSYEVAVIVVAHPTKEAGLSDVSLYGIEGSAHWVNKPDHGLIVDRETNDEGDLTGLSVLKIQKVRFQPETGRKGEVLFGYDPDCDRFTYKNGSPID
jgi:twinkle protein